MSEHILCQLCANSPGLYPCSEETADRLEAEHVCKSFHPASHGAIDEAINYHRVESLRHHGRIFDLAVMKHLPTMADGGVERLAKRMKKGGRTGQSSQAAYG